MKVLVSTFGGDGGKSGIGQYIIRLMQEFPRIAPDIQFDLLVFEGEEDLYATASDQIRILPVSGKWRNPMKNLAWQQVMMPRLCKKGNYDLLFVPAGNRRMPFWVPCPSICTFLDYAILHVDGKYDWIHTFYNRHVLPVLVRRRSHVITISEFSKRDLIEYVGMPEEDVTITYLAADAEEYYPRNKAAAAARVAEHYGIRQPYLLYIARIEHPGKNHARLIRAFDRLKQREALPHQLVIAGSDWHGAEEVHRIAETCASAEDILFTGFVAQETIPDLYCAAELFVFPSLFEGFGLPILEAMASGVPVACANAASMPEIAGKAAPLFDPMNEADLEDVLQRLLLDEQAKADCIEKGLVRAQSFSWEKTTRETVACFRQLCGEDR